VSESDVAEASTTEVDVDEHQVLEATPQLFDPPPPSPRVRARRLAATKNLEPPSPAQPELLDPPLQPIEALDHLWRPDTPEERRLLAEIFHGLEDCTLPVGESLYAALARIGARAKRRPLRPSDWFEASRDDMVKELRECRDQRTLNPYLKALRAGGLLDRRQRGRGQPNLWRLPRCGVPPRRATSNQSSVQERQPVTIQARKNGNRSPSSLKEERNSGEKNGARARVVPFPGKQHRGPTAPDFNIGVRR
jgi:hypothetical protein